MKKIISLLLTFAMLFSLAMPAMAAEGDTKTIYFDNTKGWTDIKAYAFDANETKYLGEWPGTAMTKVEGTENIYSIEVSTAATKIIFNDGKQSDEQTIPTDGKNLYNNDTWSVYSDAGAGTPSGGGSANNTSHDVTATYTPSYEAKWGISKDDLTNNGTLADAINAAAADRSITYIQLQKNVTTVTGYLIRGGVFTLDLNGKTITSNIYSIDVRNPGTQVTLTDTATGGAVISDGAACSAVVARDGGKVVIDGGSYTGSYAVKVEDESVAEIKDGNFTGTDGYAFSVIDDIASAIIEDGTFSGAWAAIASSGTTTIKGGTFSTGTMGHIAYWNGTLDLSGCNENKLNGLTLSQRTDSDLTVSDETIKLPDGYVFKDRENNTVDTLASRIVYTIGTEGGKTTYTITVETDIDGTVTVPASAAEGDTVTVVFIPNAGFALFNQAAIDISNPVNHVELIPGTEANTFTFIMPAYDVHVVGAFVKDGRARDDLYFNNGGNTAWTNVNAYFYTDSGNLLETVRLTMAENGIYTLPEGTEIPNLAYHVIFSCGSESTVYEVISTGEENMFTLGSTTDTSGDYEGTWSKYTPSQPPEDTTSAEIVWGSMSFTYDDTIDESTKAEKGWTPAAEAGAGTVTVKNTGDTAFTANISYTAVAEYAEITGTFDADSADLAAEASKIFTLTLNGKPNKAITAGTKIGSVTIVIVNDSGSSDEDESDVTIVTDGQGLKDAIAKGGEIKLGESITMASSEMYINNNVTLDLNNKTLTTTGNGLFVNVGATLNVSNGTISGDNIVANVGGTVSVEGCTLTGRVEAFCNGNGSSSLKNCTVNGRVSTLDGTVTLYENITFGHGTGDTQPSGIWVDGGNVICHFDPTDHINVGSLSDNGNGTWTVSPEAAE